METKYTYKKQGDGRDSWVCEVTEGDKLIDKYMVYEDPETPNQKVDLKSIFMGATSEEIEFIKQLLNTTPI